MADLPYSDSELLSSFLLELYGGDPFAHVYTASNEHREAHGPDCGVYPSEPVKMRLLAGITRAAGATRILEIGCGLGYSALWLAEAAGPDGLVETIDRFPEHTDLARRYVEEAGLGPRVRVLTGEGADILRALAGAGLDDERGGGGHAHGSLTARASQAGLIRKETWSAGWASSRSA